jgi:adenine-specific DNA-methyltransferase
MLQKNFDGYSREDLIKEIKKLKDRKKYGLVWEDKPEEVALLCKEKLPVLKDVKNKEIVNDKQKPFHVLIEGDNFHALSVMNYTHKGKIDLIYLDPPYNTGAKDWKYNNDYVDINDQWRHSKWLSFMSKRLEKARKLLSKTGVLICTIDKNEHSPLGLLLQEIFHDREIVSIVIVHNPAGVQGKNFSFVHEYAYFVYPKKGKFIGQTTREEDQISPLRDWGGTSARNLAKNCFYPIKIKDGKIIEFGDTCKHNVHPKSSNIIQKDGSIEIYPIDQNGIERKWVYSSKKAEENKSELSCKKVNGQWVIKRKKELFTHRTVWSDKKYYANIYGSKLLNNIISSKFPYPKSLYAVEDCIKAVIHDKNNAVILDVFAGSGTTGHAVLELNEQDNGKRKFILCTNNENNICDDVCYPRLKKIIKGYVGIIDKKQYEGLGGNLKYFKTDFVDGSATDRNKKKLADESTEMLCFKENCFYEIKSKQDFKIFSNNNEKYVGILYDINCIEYFKKEIKKINRKINTYVFSLDENIHEEEFEEVSQLVELKPIPEGILNTYRKIFR